ncbi:DUF6461 domain-containing protein [Streptomyces sp. RLB1-33]
MLRAGQHTGPGPKPGRTGCPAGLAVSLSTARPGPPSARARRRGFQRQTPRSPARRAGVLRNTSGGAEAWTVSGVSGRQDQAPPHLPANRGPGCPDFFHRYENGDLRTAVGWPAARTGSTPGELNPVMRQGPLSTPRAARLPVPTARRPSARRPSASPAYG